MRERRVGDEQEPVQPVARRLLGLEEPLVLDRERRAPGHALEQLDVAGRERAVRERSHVDDADHGPAHGQRYAEQGLDSFLAQNRVEDVGAANEPVDDIDGTHRIEADALSRSLTCRVPRARSERECKSAPHRLRKAKSRSRIVTLMKICTHAVRRDGGGARID